MKLTCIAIDDEPLALKLLENFIRHSDDLELVASFNSSQSAQLFLLKNQVDCIFLDIEMPELNGIDFVKSLSENDVKASIVFVSAYSNYAIEGFKVSATDFLLKPYSFEDFERTISKIKHQKNLENLLKQNDDIFIKIDAKQVKIKLSSILYIESMKDYLKIYSEEKELPYIPLMTLKKMKENLPDNFIQINRSHIINFNKVTSFGKNNLIIGKKEFNLSEKYKSDFEKYIK
ncbi:MULTISPECIES: LytTR family DNA-binding domain-containing protein [unclassified Empedobacter]|uniref:LytR/AlgR family response regulator transcription factor n=1 Tax=unclassified Empedobacter TaxID=2643773 RepID=UPI00244C61FA|nr:MULTISPECIES: LytTR family DNA-binding domain-containing protein [unclassified Empedobacter]MDH1881538.1 LytTR family DNA-binding domain-containing protein [Empedobacter sp. GD03797]